MKKVLLNIVTIFITIISFSQNVSTGLGAVGTQDTWKVGTITPATGSSYVLPTTMFSGIWEPTPISGTNAKWISLTTNGNGSGMTDYFYEKAFTVSASIKELKCNFKVAVDDVLKKIELVNGTTIINIPFTTPPYYKLTNLITETVKCPKAGDWKLRVTVFCGDPKGSQGPTALLVSGNIEQVQGSCDAIITSTCCPPWNKEILASCITPKFVGSGLNSPYQLLLNTSATVMQRLNAYVNYLYLICPYSASSKFAISFEVGAVSGPNQPFVAANRAVCTSWIIFNTANEPIVNNLILGSWCIQGQTVPPANPTLQPNQWYVIQSYLDNSNDGTTSCIGNDCKIANVWNIISKQNL
jgi:hypothetical protein